ncbi:MAG TPA: polynucleotide adenylyltransferase PcnB, partial [Thermoanaerobaculia bacterium]|nr:polynucleotide adenylyltransferase PcnB [Thermoanaerobaculia bacterium]
MKSTASLPRGGLARFVESGEKQGSRGRSAGSHSERPWIDKRTNRTPLPPVPGRVFQPSARLGPSFFSVTPSRQYNHLVSADTGVEPRIVPRSEHPISRRDISANAVKVLYRLHNAGYMAGLVGGSVRDLMLNRRPKDYDIGTDAKPNEIRRLFSNSRIIGRRFRLVHVYFHDGEIVEVSTFRRDPDPDEQRGEPGELLITSDNAYGTPEQDAFRRDFTINALFYDIGDFSVVDYVGGIEDLDRKLVHVIGDPDKRFREDPVRMLRACEFAGRLGFGIESRTQEAIHRHRKELDKASPARVTEEIAQLLRCGHAGAAMQWMLDLGLLEVLLPEAYAMVAASERGLGNFGQILPVIDGMVRGGRQLSDIGLLAALLLPKVIVRRYDIEALDQRPMSRSAIEVMIQEEVTPFLSRFTVSNLKSQQIIQALV